MKGAFYRIFGELDLPASYRYTTHWIKDGKLDSSTAYYQLQAMEAIVKTLRKLDIEQRQLSLFTLHHEDPA